MKLAILLLLVVSTISFRLRLGRRYLSTTKSELYANKHVIALTREIDENEKLLALLPDLKCLCLPCITFQKIDGEISKLEAYLNSHKLNPQFDSIVLTSPQAAIVFIEAYNKANRPSSVKIASVGKGTSKPLIENSIDVDFEPSEAIGKRLAAELPSSFGSTILYPGSALADTSLQIGLQARKFNVIKLNTYTTVSAEWTTEDYTLAKEATIVTFASPSTIKVWKERVGIHQTAVVIGPTSERAAKEAGFKYVYSPAEGSKGIEAWATLIREVADIH